MWRALGPSADGPGEDPLESVIAWFGPGDASKVIAADVRRAPH